MAKRKGKIRTDFRKNRSGRARQGDLTRRFHALDNNEDAPHDERVSGKGELTRRRTVKSVADDPGQESLGVVLDVAGSSCVRGRVLSVHGLTSMVQTEDGRLVPCATRRLLKTLSTDQRHVVAAGDRVMIRLASGDEGIIERVEPRHGVLSRTVRGRQQILVANVDQLLIIGSAAEPHLKPHLIDRFVCAAEQSGIVPLICINKIDLIDPATLQPLVGVYAQMGYRVLLTSTVNMTNIDRLRRALSNRQSVVAGQSGVGKSSLLNAVDPEFGLRVAQVSSETQKGRHTTTTARLLSLANGAYVVDTPGIRQFQLWNVIPAEVAGLYRDLRPFVSHCAFPNCTHTHENECAVKHAVADGWLDARRYESYCQLFSGDMAT